LTAAKGFNVGYEGNGNLFFIREDNSGTVTDRFVIDDSGNVGIGTSSPGNPLHVQNSAVSSAPSRAGSTLYLENNSNCEIQFVGNPANDCQLRFGTSSNSFKGALEYQLDVDALVAYTNSSERMRIQSSGIINIKTTNNNPPVNNVTGAAFRENGTLNIAASSAPVVQVGRTDSDGELITFFQAGTKEGTITVSGTTVSYNGAHLSRWSQLSSGAERTEILRGSVLSNLDEMCEWGEEDNEQLNRMKVSDVEGDVNVAGVFQSWDDDDDTYTNDFYCAMTGDFIIRIAQGTTVARGDLLMSAGDGTAKPQDDDIVRSKTIAKVTSTVVSETYTDGSYCVPCVLMAC
jgi:hypothetical protein